MQRKGANGILVFKNDIFFFLFVNRLKLLTRIPLTAAINITIPKFSHPIQKPINPSTEASPSPSP